MKIEDIQIGYYIKDIEDGDLYFFGIVTSVNPINYLLIAELCDGKLYPPTQTGIIPLQWSELEVFIDNKWHKVI